MVLIDQSRLVGQIRDRPISRALQVVLHKAGRAAKIDKIIVTSGGQPGSSGRRKGSTRHDGGRAADLHLVVAGRTLTFSDEAADDRIKAFVTAAAANGATGIGAGLRYMGESTLHVGFGKTADDNETVVWGAGGQSRNAPAWLRTAAHRGWKSSPSPEPSSANDAAIDILDHEDEIPEDEHIGDGGMSHVAPRYPSAVVRLALESQDRWGVPASVTLAQWALESGYGTRMPMGSNNPFGIKARPGEPHVSATTTEEKNGRERIQGASFRKFSSIEEAFQRHGELLGSASVYKLARKHLDDPDRFARALSKAYATDSRYGSKLVAIMKQDDLYRFDVQVPTIGDDRSATERLGSHRHGDNDAIRTLTLQKRLVELGYNLGKIDGKFGPLTAAALLSFQYDNDLPTTGVLDGETEIAMGTAEPRRLDLERITDTESDIAAAGSRIVVDARRNRILGWVTTLLGALGLGNSAVVNSSADAGRQAALVLPDSLMPFLAEVQRLGPSSPSGELERLADTARTLSTQLGPLGLPPELAAQLTRLRGALPPNLVAANPDLAGILNTVGPAPSPRTDLSRTMFDVLPTLFADGSVLQSAMHGVATVASSLLPGFAGSVAAIGLGLTSRYLSNRISHARVEDHRKAANIGPLV